MAIVLIVEDGSVVPGANTYSDLITARQYAEERGLVLSSDDDVLASTLIQGYDIVNAPRANYKGSRVTCDQTGAWPRTKVKVDGCDIPSDSIPSDLVHANIQAAAVVEGGTVVNPVSDGKEIASERVEGAVDVSYFESGNISQKPILNAVNELVKPYLRNSPGMVLGTRI